MKNFLEGMCIFGALVLFGALTLFFEYFFHHGWPAAIFLSFFSTAGICAVIHGIFSKNEKKKAT